MTARIGGWLFEAVPKGRVAAFRTVVYLFVALDLVWFTPWVRSHASIPGAFYQPLWIGRVLHLPTPTPLLVHAIFWTLIPVALAAASGRAPRVLGWAVFALYSEWMIIAMSYGKVDHDRFGLLIALAVLPTAGRARHGDDTMTERGGWALRMTQLAVIATYFLSSWAKLRFGGLGWLTSATLERAVIRRGTPLTDLLTSSRWPLLLGQFGIVAFELYQPDRVLREGPRPLLDRRLLLLLPPDGDGHDHDLVRAAPGRDVELPATGEGPPDRLGPGRLRRSPEPDPEPGLEPAL